MFSNIYFLPFCREAGPYGLWGLSSPNRDWTLATAVQVPNPNNEATRELPASVYSISQYRTVHAAGGTIQKFQQLNSTKVYFCSYPDHLSPGDSQGCCSPQGGSCGLLVPAHHQGSQGCWGHRSMSWGAPSQQLNTATQLKCTHAFTFLTCHRPKQVTRPRLL